MEETIYLKEVLEIMRIPNAEGRAVPFDISVRTFNRFSKEGGKLNTYKNARLVMKEKGLDPNSVYALQHFRPAPEVTKKNPQHFTNKTRNLRLENGDKRKIHINYIISFNGKNVIY